MRGSVMNGKKITPQELLEREVASGANVKQIWVYHPTMGVSLARVVGPGLANIVHGSN